MSFKEVGQLRKTGKLQEALNMALDDYNQNADIWNARSLYWVHSLRNSCSWWC